MKRLMGILILSLYSLMTLFPQELWTGSALGGSASEFPSGGLTAASNSFPLGSQVDVTNPSTGQTVRVTISSRVNEPGILLLLSGDAAAQLGVDQRFPTVIQAQPAPQAPAPRFSSVEDPFSSDPDLNPAASVGDPNAFLFDRSPIPELTFPEPQTPFVATEPFDPFQTAQPSTSPAVTPSLAEPRTEPITAAPSATDPQMTMNGTNGSAFDLPLDQTQILATEPQPLLEPIPQVPQDSQISRPVEEPVQPTTPQQGISSALQNFRGPGTAGQSLLAQRLAEQEAIQQPIEQPIEQQPIAQDPLADQIAQAQAQTEPEPEPLVTEPRIPREPEPKPEPKPEPVLEPIIDTPVATIPDEVPTTSPRIDPVDSSGALVVEPRVPDLPQVDQVPTVQAPTVQETPPTIVRPTTPGPGFATPLLSDPLSEHLGEYRTDFSEPPLTRAAAGGPMEPGIPRLVAPRSTEPRVGQTTPTVELSQVEADNLRTQAPTTQSPIAQMPVPNFEPDRPEVTQPRLNPTIVTQPRANLPITRIPEAENFDDLITRMDPGLPRSIHPSAQALPLLRAPELAIASDDINRVPSPRGVSAGIAIPPPQIRSQEAGDPGIARVDSQATIPTSNLTEPRSPLTQAEPGIPLLGSPGQPEFLITLVPAEFRAPGALTESPIGTLSPTDSDPRAPLALAGDPPRPDVFTQPEVPRDGDLSAQLNLPADPAEAIVEVFPDPQIPPTSIGESGLALAQDPPSPETLTQPVVPEDQGPQARLAIPDPTQEPRVVQEAPVTQPQDSTEDLMVFLEPAESQPPIERVPQTFVPVERVTPPVTIPPATTPPVTLEQPRVVEPTRPQAAVVAPAITSQVVERLDRESFYVQIGAFSNPDIARQALSQINPGYPITITQIPGTERPLFRLFVGPLTEDEKGTALFWFRARGYRDAFIRSGAESL